MIYYFRKLDLHKPAMVTKRRSLFKWRRERRRNELKLGNAWANGVCWWRAEGLCFSESLKVGGVIQGQPSLQARYLHLLIHSCTQMVNTSIGATYNGILESMELIKQECTCPSKRSKEGRKKYYSKINYLTYW